MITGHIVCCLRIDNSWRSMICTFSLTSETIPCTLSSHISKNRAHVNDMFIRFDLI